MNIMSQNLFRIGKLQQVYVKVMHALEKETSMEIMKTQVLA